MGSRIFAPQGSSVEDRRVARGTRRILRRRKGRVNRTRELFIKYKYLDRDQIKEINNVKGQMSKNPYELRLKGKKEILSYEELCIVLSHYAKGRGFKSNRKVKEKGNDSTNASEEQKLLFAKQRTESTLKSNSSENHNYTITNLLMDNFARNKKIRNSSGNYTIGITREMIEKEVTMILDEQIRRNLISEYFKKEYLNILLFQRLFSEGPDEPSKYHNPLQNMIGTCTFVKGESRAAKAAVSSELFMLVQKLHYIRFNVDGEKRSLYTEEVKRLVDDALTGEEITYKKIQKIIGKDVKFKGLSVPKAEYFKIIEDIKKENLDSSELEKKLNDARLKNKVSELKQYKKLRNQLIKSFGKDYANSITMEQYDLIADCLTRCKSDNEIEQYLMGKRTVLREVPLPQDLIELIPQLDDDGFSKFGRVSFTYLYEVLPLMIDEGKDFTKATSEKYGHHSQLNFQKEDSEIIAEINELLEKLDKTITNKAVVRTLVEARKIINAVVQTYGKPATIHIELARELTKSEKERKQIEDAQKSNQLSNEALRYQIFSKHKDKFNGLQSVNNEVLTQYKLFIEQGGICPYTLLITGDESKSKINENDLFTYAVEIDHIIPYSKCFDDRLVNKVLVKKEMNQNKGNQTPLEWKGNSAGYNKYCAWINRSANISEEKRKRYLVSKLTDDLLDDFRARTLNDTRYATVALKNILGYTFPSVKIRAFTGQITAKLRGVYRLNGLTHSYQSYTYKLNKNIDLVLKKKYEELAEMIEQNVSRKDKEYIAKMKEIGKLEEDEKDRENHLHHALDATLIAIATDSVRRKVARHEMALRMKDDYKAILKVPVFNSESGEFEGYEEEAKDINQYRQEKGILKLLEKKKFPLPYENFDNEVIFRVFEMDKQRLEEQLSGLTQYDNVNLSTIYPLFVSHHYSSKVSGKLHKGKYYGKKETEKGTVLTERILIDNEKFNVEKLAGLVDKDTTQKYVYSAILEWLDGYNNGKEAYAARKKYPKNKNGNEIKKVKLTTGDLKEEFLVKVNEKKYVEKEDVVQVHVYTRKNDDKLYFSGMDRYRILNAADRDDLNIFLWWRGSNYKAYSKEELIKDGFCKQPMILNKGQIIYIEKRDGTVGLAKVIGFTSGLFEVGSIVGDGMDLTAQGLFKNQIDRFRIPVFQIKSIKPISVSTLGKIKSRI